MWVKAKEALWNCVWLVLESVRVVHNNRLVFCCIMCFTTLPLSFLLFTLAISTHTLRSHIYHLEAVARVASTLMEARHVWHESRDDAVLLLRIRALFYLLCLPFSIAAAVSAVHTTHSAVQGKPVTVKSASAAVRDGWKRPFVTAIFVYVILLSFAPVPRVIALSFTSSGSRFLAMAIGKGVEVYLMAVLGMGLVVSVAEERLGWEAISVGSGLMWGRRLFGWVISGLFVTVSGLINRRVELFLLEDPNSGMGVFWDKTVLICCYGLAVLLSYVVTTVFYCDSRRRHDARELEELDDCEPVSSSCTIIFEPLALIPLLGKICTYHYLPTHAQRSLIPMLGNLHTHTKEKKRDTMIYVVRHLLPTSTEYHNNIFTISNMRLQDRIVTHPHNITSFLV